LPARLVECGRRLDSLDQLPAVLRATAATGGPRTLDLIAHTTSDHQLLRFGQSVLDMRRPAIAALFEAIREDLPRHGVSAVRLLGCGTAARPVGQITMRRLARTLGLPVHGTHKALLASHYRDDGFNPLFDHILVTA